MHASRVLRKLAVLVLASLMLAGAKPVQLQSRLAAAMFATARWPYLPGSILPLRIDGITVPYHIAVLGIGQLVQNSNAYSVPSTATGGSALLIAGNAHALGSKRLQIASAPRVAGRCSSSLLTTTDSWCTTPRASRCAAFSQRAASRATLRSTARDESPRPTPRARN